MALADDVARIRSRPDSVDADEFLEALSRIKQEMRTLDARQYLEKKIDVALSAEEDERRQLCRNLLPYLDWYLAGPRG